MYIYVYICMHVLLCILIYLKAFPLKHKIKIKLLDNTFYNHLYYAKYLIFSISCY